MKQRLLFSTKEGLLLAAVHVMPRKSQAGADFYRMGFAIALGTQSHSLFVRFIYSVN